MSQSKSHRVMHLYQRTFGQGPLHGGVLRTQRSYLRSLITRMRRLLGRPLPVRETQPATSTPSSSCEPASASA